MHMNKHDERFDIKHLTLTSQDSKMHVKLSFYKLYEHKESIFLISMHILNA